MEIFHLFVASSILALTVDNMAGKGLREIFCQVTRKVETGYNH